MNGSRTLPENASLLRMSPPTPAITSASPASNALILCTGSGSFWYDHIAPRIAASCAPLRISG